MNIAESLEVHDGRQETLIPALDKWIERQKKLEEQKDPKDSANPG